MSNHRTQLIFFGNEQLSSTRADSECSSFKMLVDEGYAIEKLIVKGKPQKSRKVRVPAIVHLAEQHNIPVVTVANKKELLEAVKDVKSDIAVLAAFGLIIGQEIIDLFKYGIVNIHPSLLPKYRGTTPIETAILSGDDKTGVSIMKLTAEMDAGPIYAYGEYHMSGQESKEALTKHLGQLGAALLREILPGIIEGYIPARPQDEERASFTNMLSKKDSVLDFNKPAIELDREIRAFLDWPGSKTRIKKIDVIITGAHAVPVNHPGLKPGDVELDTDLEHPILQIETINGYLCIDKLKPTGKSEMTTGEFMNGYAS